MQIIHDFIVKVKQMLREYPDVEFCDYTGSWYPLYYQVGVNWADQTYAGNEFPGVIKQNCSRQLMQEKLIRYFPAVIMRMSPYQRRKRTKTSRLVQRGRSRQAGRTCGRKCNNNCGFPVFGSVSRDTTKISQAIAMCMEHSAGCMLFDLSYLVKDNWWKYANAVEYSQMKPGIRQM